MPQCENCGETHATVNPAEWVNDEIMLCPACWGNLTELLRSDNGG